MVNSGTERLEFRDLSEVRSGTDRREDQESQGSRRRAQLQQAQRLENLGQLAGGIAEDFNDLLDVILGYACFVSAELAAPSGPDSPARLESVRRDLGEIAQAAERAAGLTCQPLALAHPQVAHPEAAHPEAAHPQVPDLDHVATDVREILRPTLAERVKLVTTLAGDLWPVLADPTQQALRLIWSAKDSPIAGSQSACSSPRRPRKAMCPRCWPSWHAPPSAGCRLRRPVRFGPRWLDAIGVRVVPFSFRDNLVTYSD
jgi:signal transduction histidine kinase